MVSAVRAIKESNDVSQIRILNTFRGSRLGGCGTTNWLSPPLSCMAPISILILNEAQPAGFAGSPKKQMPRWEQWGERLEQLQGEKSEVGGSRERLGAAADLVEGSRQVGRPGRGVSYTAVLL